MTPPVRPDLLALTTGVLAELTNPGTVRRAVKELDAGARFTFTVAVTPGGDVVTAVDGDLLCVLGTGPFDTWTCTCTTGERCRDLVRAVLDWQRRCASEPVGSPERPEPPVPADGSDEGPPAAGLPDGVVAEVGIGATQARVRLLHPEHVAVRFLVGGDPRYARCGCGTAGCGHVALARAALDLHPGRGSAVVAGTCAPVVVPERWRAQWRRWAAQLVELGLPAAAELMGGAVRLATAAEREGLAAPAAVLREIAEQLQLRSDHSSRLSPVRLVELVGELEARLRALDVAALPGPLVAGTPPARRDVGQARLAGLGASYRQVGGWHELRAFVADTGSGAVRTVTLTRTDTVDLRHAPPDLALVRHRGARMVDWAAGRGLLPSARRVDDELVTPRGRWTLLATPAPEADPAVFAPPVGAAEEVPAVLGPRRPADGVGMLAVGEVQQVTVVADVVTARLIAPAGDEAVLRLCADPRAGDAGRLLAATLRGTAAGPVVAVAGRWRPSSAGPPVVTPTAVWSASGCLLPQLGVVVGRDGSVDRGQVTPAAPDDGAGTGDPWAQWWSTFGEVLGRLLVTGARRGAAPAARALHECADQAAGLGLVRCAALARDLADRPEPEPVLDAAVLLALAD